MKYKYKGITVFVVKDYEAMSKKAAQMLVSQVIMKGESILGLATGSTPERMYAHVVESYKEGEVDFSEVTSFNLDEYYNLEPANPQSYAYYMHDHFFDHVNMKTDRIHVPNGQVKDVEAYCEGYDSAIDAVGGIDLQILGIGNNGHIGFNEPDVHFESGTHLVDLDEDTIEANARFFSSIEEVPKQAISMGIRTIMHSKKIILMASGEKKAPALHGLMFGDITPNLPASILQLHNDVTLILDEAAAKEVVPVLESLK